MEDWSDCEYGPTGKHQAGSGDSAAWKGWSVAIASTPKVPNMGLPGVAAGSVSRPVKVVKGMLIFVGPMPEAVSTASPSATLTTPGPAAFGTSVDGAAAAAVGGDAAASAAAGAPAASKAAEAVPGSAAVVSSAEAAPDAAAYSASMASLFSPPLLPPADAKPVPAATTAFGGGTSLSGTEGAAASAMTRPAGGASSAEPAAKKPKRVWPIFMSPL